MDALTPHSQWIKNAIFYANTNNCWATAQAAAKTLNHSAESFFFFQLNISRFLRSVVFAHNVNNVIYVRRSVFTIRSLFAQSDGVNNTRKTKVLKYSQFFIWILAVSRRYLSPFRFIHSAAQRLAYWAVGRVSPANRTYIETEPFVEKVYKKRLFRSLH